MCAQKGQLVGLTLCTALRSGCAGGRCEFAIVCEGKNVTEFGLIYVCVQGTVIVCA